MVFTRELPRSNHERIKAYNGKVPVFDNDYRGRQIAGVVFQQKMSKKNEPVPTS